MNGALLVAGTHSDAGKSVVVAGICRWLAREGVKVAPFKAQNMALNSFVTREGAEIGRAQAAQAAAAMVEPAAAMNPVLLKPSAERTTQVVVRGKAWATASARSYGGMKKELLPVVLESLEELRRRFEVVVCEGAGSPAEINLRENDLANMGLARAANLPVLLVGDIDRGGLFASLYGTLALLSPEDQQLVAGFLVNKFRGDPAVLAPGLTQMTALTGRPFLGTLPWVRGLGLDGEDSLALDVPRPVKPPLGRDVLRVAVVRLGRISNFTDFDALAHEPGVSVRFTESEEEILAADLAVLPGTKATVEDLKLLRSRGLDGAFAERAKRSLPTLGICGGYQMLGGRIVDGVESGEAKITGLGLLPVETVFEGEKVLSRPEGWATGFGGAEISGYEIHHGRVQRHGGESLFTTDGDTEGCQTGATLGTSWHGVLESDGFRRAFLAWVAEKRDLDWKPGGEFFAAARETQLEKLGDLVAEHVDREALMRLIEYGAPRDLPVVSSRLLSSQPNGRYPQPLRSTEPPNGSGTPPEPAPALAPTGNGNASTNLKSEA
ncbi:MAG: cobyric acid synthase [Actinobacteria bacterium]|nr:cobyric acid synthase [Actinomycetota bacterium]